MKKLSPLHIVKIEVNEQEDTLFNHIILSLRKHEEKKVSFIQDISQATHFIVGGEEFKIDKLANFVKLMWYKYLNNIPPSNYHEIKQFICGNDELFDEEKREVYEAFTCGNKGVVLEGCYDFISSLKNSKASKINSGLISEIPKEVVLLNPVEISGEMKSPLSRLLTSEAPIILKKHFLFCKQYGFQRNAIGSINYYGLNSFTIANILCSESNVINRLEVTSFINALYKISSDVHITTLYKLGANVMDVEWDRIMRELEKRGNYSII